MNITLTLMFLLGIFWWFSCYICGMARALACDPIQLLFHITHPPHMYMYIACQHRHQHHPSIQHSSFIVWKVKKLPMGTRTNDCFGIQLPIITLDGQPRKQSQRQDNVHDSTTFIRVVFCFNSIWTHHGWFWGTISRTPKGDVCAAPRTPAPEAERTNQ